MFTLFMTLIGVGIGYMLCLKENGDAITRGQDCDGKELEVLAHDGHIDYTDRVVNQLEHDGWTRNDG